MNPEIFKRIECHTGNDLETIGFTGEFENYYISFYGKIEDEFRLFVESYSIQIDEDFWNPLTPSNKDLEAMQNIISQYHWHLLQKIEKGTEKEFNVDWYAYYGLKENMFY